MADEIFLVAPDGKLIEMRAHPYDTEHVLQELLANYPNLISGEQIDSDDPRRWLLVSREVSVPSDEDGGGRASLDHLFLDQYGIPTLVEVKRSTDTRIRRQVVGQMLDYAANAVVYWSVEDIRRHFEARCEADGADPVQELGELLGVEVEADAFWGTVKTNLQAGKVRLLFIADAIPRELRRIVEFLNSQMDPAEVLAFEIKQYVGGGRQTLVPRIVGQTAEALQKKASGRGTGRRWDEEGFFAELEEKRGRDETRAARALLEWARSRADRVWWGTGARSGSFGDAHSIDGTKYNLFAATTYGSVEVYFQWLRYKPAFTSEDRRQELRHRLNQVPGVDIPPDGITRRPTIPLEVLVSEQAMVQFLAVLDWVIDQASEAE